MVGQDDRKILFVVDPEGNAGKTFLRKYMALMNGAARFENGKSSDIKHGYNGEEMVIFDLTRTAAERINKRTFPTRCITMVCGQAFRIIA